MPTKRRAARPPSLRPLAAQMARDFLAANAAYKLAAAPILADAEYTTEQGRAYDTALKAMYAAAYDFALSCAAEVAGTASAVTP